MAVDIKAFTFIFGGIVVTTLFVYSKSQIISALPRPSSGLDFGETVAPLSGQIRFIPLQWVESNAQVAWKTCHSLPLAMAARA